MYVSQGRRTLKYGGRVAAWLQTMTELRLSYGDATLRVQDLTPR
jgi:hypothetical protein